MLLLGILSRSPHAVMVGFVWIKADGSSGSYDFCQNIIGTRQQESLIIAARDKHTA